MQKALDPQQKLRRKRRPVRRRGSLICNQLQQKQQRNRRQHHPQKPQGKLPPQRKCAQTRFFPFHLFSPLFTLPQRPGFRFACFFICDCLSFGQRCRLWRSGFLSPRRSAVLFRKEFAFFGFAPWRSSAFYFIVAGFCGKRYGELPAKIPKTSFFCLFYSSFMRKKRQVSTRAGVLLRVVFAIGSNQVVFRRIGTNGSSFQKIPHVLQWNH